MSEGYAAAGGALAVTAITFDETSGDLLHADVIVNGVNSLAVLPAGSLPPPGATPVANDPATGSGGSSSAPEDTGGDDAGATWGAVNGANSFDFQHVIAHELGHTLGLGDDESLTSALMYAYTAPGDATHRSPTADEVSGVRILYTDSTVSAQAAGCGGATVAAGRAGDSQGLAIIAMLFGFAAFLAARGRARRLVPLLVAFALFAMASRSARSESSGRTNVGHAQAHVTQAETTMVRGLFHTIAHVTTTTCRIESCPTESTMEMWGGTARGITQIVGETRAVGAGEDVEIDFRTGAAGHVIAALHPGAIRS